MPDLTPRQITLYGLAALVLAVLAIWYAGREDVPVPATAPPAIKVQGEKQAPALTVHVAGAVRRPGVYRMRAGSRVDQAVTRAGGPRRRADLGALNLAAEVEDGRQVLVPVRAAGAPTAAAPTAGASSPAAAPAAGAPPAAAAGAPVNLNTATPEQLDALDGIGPATAASILEYREAHGGFSSLEELDQVPGIGEARLASLREQVTL